MEKGFMNYFIGQIQKDIEHKYDCVMIIDGAEGCGKSTLGWHLKALFDGYYSLEHALFDGSDLIESMITLDKGSSLITDESILCLYKRDAMQSYQIQLGKSFSIVRARNLFFILIIPNYFDMDPHLRVRARYRIYVYSKGRQRGYARLYQTNRNAFTTGRPYLEHLCDFRFPDLPENFKPMYETFKENGLGQSLNQINDDMKRAFEDDKEKQIWGRANLKIKKMRDIQTEHPAWTAAQIADAVPCSIGYVKSNLGNSLPKPSRGSSKAPRS